MTAPTHVRCRVCDRKALGGTLPTGTARKTADGSTHALDGLVCGVCLASSGIVSEDAYARMHGEENGR